MKKLPTFDFIKNKAYRCYFILLTLCLLTACSSLQRVVPLKDIEPEDVDPRVSFVDNRKIEVETSAIESVDAEIVIQSYRRLLTRGNPEIRKEALHRLADLTMRLSEAKIGLEDSDKKVELTAAMKGASFNQAIQLYESLLKEFPGYRSTDEVKYQLARAHSLNSDPEASLNILDQIAVAHQGSLSYVESQFRRGESYFSRREYQVADLAYTKVIQKGVNSEYYEKALYKRGWSYFKQSLYTEALKDFFNLYERLLSQKGTQFKRLQRDLIVDTRRVISLAFYNQDGADSVKKYFATYGSRPFEDEIYAQLAELYIEQERFQDAADTYIGFVERNPLSLSAPDFHSRVIEIYRKGGFPSLILPAKESFVTQYGRTSAFWQKYSGKVIDKLKPLLRAHLDDISRFYHAKAQKSKKRADYLTAARWYREILATFQEPSIDSRYRFALAEALLDGGEALAAAKEFEIVAYKNKPSSYSRDAGYKALLAYQLVKYSKEATALEKLLPSIQSGLAFSKNFPSDLKSPQILARVAEQQLSIQNVQGAIDASNQLLRLTAKPSLKQAQRARVIIANGLFDLKKYGEAAAAITSLLAQNQLTQKQRISFKERRAQSLYKLAEAAKLQNKNDEAVALFLKVRKLEPNSTVAANALFDAATLQLQSKKWKEATSLLETFRRAYPRHALTSSIPEKLAFIYEKEKNWNRAASEYQLLAAAQPDKKSASQGYWHVAELYEKAGNKSKAISAYKYYVRSYSQPYLLAQEGRNKLVVLYTKAGDISKATFWRQKIVNNYASNKNSNNTRTAFLAAESKYILSEPLYQKFRSIKLKLPLGSSLKRKRKAMKNALNAYNNIAKYNVAKYTSGSTQRVAKIYQVLSEDLMASQRPRGLNEEELEEYGFLLEEQALPFEDKAINYYEVNAKRTKDGIYNDAVRESISALSKLKPAQYDKKERVEVLRHVTF